MYIRRFYLLLLLFTFNLQTSWALYFETPEQKVEYLYHVRTHYPELYRDFITRYNAFEFLETAQSAIDALSFKNTTIDGFAWNIYSVSDDTFDRVYNANEIRAQIISVTDILSPSKTIIELIYTAFAQAARYDALTAGIAQTDPALGLKEVLRISTPQDRLNEIAKRVAHVSNIAGINPKFLGLDKAFISGQELVQLYNEAILGRQILTRLIWLVQLSKDIPDYKTRPLESLVLRLKQQQLNYISENIGTKLEAKEIEDEKINKGMAVKMLKMAGDELKKNSTLDSNGLQKLLISHVERSHPYDAFLRGSVGDCSTTNCFGMSLPSKAEFYYIFRPDGSVKGYFQFTHVISRGKNALYLNTISGSGISRTDVRSIFHTVASSLKYLGAESILIPLPAQIPFLINFPEVRVVYEELLKTSKIADVSYLDEHDRLKLIPFNDDAIDLPEKNRQAQDVDLNVIKSWKFLSEIQNYKINPDYSFKKIKNTEALMVALELRNRKENLKGIQEVLLAYEINHNQFEQLWHTVSNEKKRSIESFHRATRDILDTLKMDYNWKTFSVSPLFFQGHMLAPDALVGNNGDLAMEYIQVLLKSFTDIPVVYEALGKNYQSLIKRTDFVELVKSLFKKNIKEFDRLLDFYELEHRSAYRTLAFLFESGLPKDTFKAEIEDLKKAWENTITEPEQANGVFFRRITLLGIISNFEPVYFNTMMSRLEAMVKTGIVLNEDAIRTVSSYFAAATNRGKLDKGQTHRMENFFSGSEFGMSFIPHLGVFPNEKINVPKLTEVLLKKEKYEWAAQLIHNGAWLKHPNAGRWTQQIWMNRDKLTVDFFLLGIHVNPNLLATPDFDKFIDDLMVRALGNSQHEMTLAKILLSQPDKMTNQRMNWLESLKNPDIQMKIKKYKNTFRPIKSGREQCYKFYKI